MKELKILHVIHYSKGGITTLISNHVNSSQNHAITYKILFFIYDEKLEKQAATRNIHIVFCNFTGIIKYWQLFFSYYKELRRFAPDIIHTHSFLPGIFGRVFSIFLKKKPKIISTVHSNYPYFTNNNIRDIFKRYIESLSIRFCNSRVIAVSQQIREELINRQEIPAELITVIPGAIKLPAKQEHPRWGQHNDKIIALTVGRLSKEKNHTLLIDAWKAVINQHPDAELWIVGDGDEMAMLTSQVKRNKLADSVKLWGWQVDITGFMLKSDLFVLSSIYEGFPIVMLEACSTGLPVVATEIPSVKQVIQHGTSGLMIPINNKAALAGAMSELMQKQHLRKRFGTEGQKIVFAKYGIDTYIIKNETIYAEVLQ